MWERYVNSVLSLTSTKVATPIPNAYTAYTRSDGMHVDIRARLHSRSIAVHNHAMKETANVEKESEQASQEQGTLRHSARCFVRFRAASIRRTLLCFSAAHACTLDPSRRHNSADPKITTPSPPPVGHAHPTHVEFSPTTRQYEVGRSLRALRLSFQTAHGDAHPRALMMSCRVTLKRRTRRQTSSSSAPLASMRTRHVEACHQ